MNQTYHFNVTNMKRIIYMWLLRSWIVRNVLLRQPRCQNSNILMKWISNFSCSTSAANISTIVGNLYQKVLKKESQKVLKIPISAVNEPFGEKKIFNWRVEGWFFHVFMEIKKDKLIVQCSVCTKKLTKIEILNLKCIFWGSK